MMDPALPPLSLRVLHGDAERRLRQDADAMIRRLLAPHPRALSLYDHIREDPPLKALWDLTSFLAVGRYDRNDHGDIHAHIVAANAMHLFRLLVGHGVQPEAVRCGAGTLEDAAVVVLLGAMLHDLGNLVSHEGHAAHGVALAQPLLTRLLPLVYGEDEVKKAIVGSLVLSAIATHECAPAPVTLEGGIVAVADAADMTSGRTQSHEDDTTVGLSRAYPRVVTAVHIEPGRFSPAHIRVEIQSPIGVRRVEELVGRRLFLSGLDRHVTMQVFPAFEAQAGGPQSYSLKQGRLRPDGIDQQPEGVQPIDPVCSAVVPHDRVATQTVYDGVRVAFCSERCLAVFISNPGKYPTR